MLSSSVVMILDKISPYMTHVEQINGHNIKFEFSGPRTAPCNVEPKFQTFYGWIRVTLNYEELEVIVRTSVWAKCTRTATFLSNITQIILIE
jgi:hypothetical protein